MTTPEATPATETALSFSAGELAALIELTDTASARTTGRLLKLDQLDDPDAARRYGISSLVARGLATVTGDEVSTAAESSVIAALIGVADGWAEIGLIDAGNAEGALLVRSAAGSLLFGADVAETYTVVGLEAGQPLGTVIAGMVFAFLDGSTPAAAAVTVTQDDAAASYAVRHNADETWELAQGEFDSEGLLPSRVTSRHEAFDALVGAWAEKA